MAYNPDSIQPSRLNSTPAMQENPVGSIAPAGFAGMAPAVAREVATIQGQIMLAKMYPRQMDEVWRKVEGACSRLKLAEAAIYQYARGGTNISGPSIRLAEALINAYGNAKSGFEVIESGDDSSRVRAYAYDMETNTIQERTFDVEHVRYAKGQRTRLTDPRDIYETIANNASRRERACILALIPGDLQDYAVSLCMKTLEEKVDITPQKLADLLKAFAPFGVSRVMIEARIQRHLDAITTTQYINLRSIYASLKDGIAKVDDFFDRDAKPIGDKPAGDAQEAPQKPRKASSQKRKEEAPQAPAEAPEASPDAAPADTEEEAMDASGMISNEPDGPVGPELFVDDDFYDRQ